MPPRTRSRALPGIARVWLTVVITHGLQDDAATWCHRCPGYFDVLHLSGHADVVDDQPVFVIEDEVGDPAVATPAQLAEALAGNWPRLVFASGCHTGRAPARGTLPSMSASLVDAGAPAVLGWALPVGDHAASLFASHLYSELAKGVELPRAVAFARREVHRAKSPYWHFLRFYSDRSPLNAFVTPAGTPRRTNLRHRQAADEFLDPATRTSRVASRSEFIGRRHQIQRCLRRLRAPFGTEEAVEGLVLHGMGGLGKSTLASRLLERMPRHQRVVWFGAIDDIQLRGLTRKLRLDSPDQAVTIDQILGHESLDLDAKFRFLLNGPLADLPCLFVFDDFENGNLVLDGDRYTWAAATNAERDSAQEIVGGLLRAIRETGSPSRGIITCRYTFPPPQGTQLHFEPLQTLDDNELTKKLLGLKRLRPDASTAADVRDRAIMLAAGNSRLLEWLNKVIDAPDVDVADMVSRLRPASTSLPEV